MLPLASAMQKVYFVTCPPSPPPTLHKTNYTPILVQHTPSLFLCRAPIRVHLTASFMGCTMSHFRTKRPHEETLAIAPTQWVKLIPRSRIRRGFEFTLGENADTKAFSDHPRCGAGLHMSQYCHIHLWLQVFQPDEAIELVLVDVPGGVLLVQDKYKAKAPRIVLHTPQPVPYEVYLRGICANRISLDYVPNYFRTQELLDAALDADPTNLAYMCTAHRTQARCERVLRHGLEDMWKYVPDALCTEAMCLMAVAANTIVIRDICATMEVAEAVAVAAVTQDPYVFRHMPQYLRTDAVIRVLRQPFDKSIFPFVPVAKQTASMRMAAVEARGVMLYHIPYEHQTAELCMAAVEEDGQAFRFAAPRFKTVELAIAAVEQTPSAIRYLKRELLVDALWTANIVQHDYNVFLELPDAYKTPAMCMAAVQDMYFCIRHVPAAYVTREMCCVAWRGYKNMVEQVGRSCLSPHMLLDNSHPLLYVVGLELGEVKCLADVPETMRTKEVCDTALRLGK